LVGVIICAVSWVGLLIVWSVYPANKVRTFMLVVAAIGALGGIAMLLGAWREWKRSRGGAKNTDN